MAESAKKKKRIVKDPETFRERALKASQVTVKPKARKRAKSGIAKVLAPLFRPIAKVLSFVFNRQPFKFVGKILGKILVPVYVRNSWKELRLVEWPTIKTSRQLTIAVLIFAIFFGASIAGIDWVLDKVFQGILLK